MVFFRRRSSSSIFRVAVLLFLQAVLLVDYYRSASSSIIFVADAVDNISTPIIAEKIGYLRKHFYDNSSDESSSSSNKDKDNNDRILQDDDCKTIADWICERNDWFCDAINDEEAGLADSLKSGEWTVFVPSYEHDQKDTYGLQPQQIVDLAKFHIVEGRTIMYDDLICSGKIEMHNGEDSRTRCSNSGDKYQKGMENDVDNTPLISASSHDLRMCNGVIHVVDNVMLPKVVRMDEIDENDHSSHDHSSHDHSSDEDHDDANNGDPNAVNVLILYYGVTSDNTKKLAEAIGEGAMSSGKAASVMVEEIRDFVGNSEVGGQDTILNWADALILGSGVVNGNPHPQMLELVNGFDFMADYSQKVGSAFVTAGGIAAGAAQTLTTLQIGMRIFGMETVGGSSWENSGGTVGITTGDENLDNEEHDLELSVDQGKRVAEVAYRSKTQRMCKMKVEPANVLVVYYDEADANNQMMAGEVAEGAKSTENASVMIKEVSKVDGKQDILDWADAVVLGSGVINGNPHPQMLELVNSFDFMGDYSKKIGSAFVTAGGIAAGAAETLDSLQIAMRIFGMQTVGGSSWENSMGTVGVTTGDLTLDNEERDLALSHNQGVNVATIAYKFKSERECGGAAAGME